MTLVVSDANVLVELVTPPMTGLFAGLLSRPSLGGHVSVIPNHPRSRLLEIDLEEARYGARDTPSSLGREIATAFEELIAGFLEAFDFVLIDCPPNMSPLARAGLLTAEFFVTPYTVDEVAVKSVAQFSEWLQLRAEHPRWTEFRIRRFPVATRVRGWRAEGVRLEESRRLLGPLNRDDATWSKIPSVGDEMNLPQRMMRLQRNQLDKFGSRYGRIKADVVKLTDRLIEFLTRRTGRQWTIKRP